MATIEELKDIIVDLRIKLLKSQIPEENCIWKYISTAPGRNCSYECKTCKEKFFINLEKQIREEINRL